MPIPEHLRSVVAKLDRADEHLKVLNQEILSYLEVCRDSVQLPTKISPHENTIRLQFEPMAEPDPRISVILGDCVHNARSALDHLWKRLDGANNFPMFGSRDGEKGWLAHRDTRLKPVPQGAHAIINSLQPCTRGDNASAHPLAILNKLSNIDKHEAIHLTRPRSVDTRFAFRDKGTRREAYVVWPPVVFHDKTEVMLTDVPEGAVKPDMDVNIKGTLFVSFKDAGPWDRKPVQEVLSRLIDFIKNSVFDPLAPFTK